MLKMKIYHNPKCSKSRQTLELLKEQGHDPEIIEYLDHPPSARELDRILELLEKEPLDIMRTKEECYRELGLQDKNLDREELIKIMIENPILIERPIVVFGDRAALGRPPEDVLRIL